MKQNARFLVLLLLPIFAYSVSISDYTFPDTFYQEAYLNGNFSLNSGNQDQASYNGNFQGFFNTVKSSLPFSWRFSILANLDMIQGPNDGDDSQTGYNLFASTSADKYIGDNNVFAYGSFDLGYRKSIGFDDADDLYAKLGIGAGYGRIINATVLAKAMRIVEDLRKYDVISRNISDSAFLELAQIIDKESEYKAKYSLVEYKKYWYEAMENVFKMEGVLIKEGTLGALGVVRIQEVLDERFGIRRHGWTIRGGVGLVLSNYDGSESDPSLDILFDYALPYSHMLQIDEKLAYSTILQDDIDHLFSNTLSLTYEISNQIDWINSLISTFFIPGAEGSENYITNTLSTSFFYYLPNQLNLNTTLNLTKVDDGIDDNGNDELTTSLFMGISYRLK